MLPPLQICRQGTRGRRHYEGHRNSHKYVFVLDKRHVSGLDYYTVGTVMVTDSVLLGGQTSSSSGIAGVEGSRV